MSEERVPCPACKALVLPGARKCRACKAWIAERPPPREARLPRAAVIVTAAVATVMAVLVTSRESPVGEAPPLTNLATDSSASSAPKAPAPGAIGPDIEPERVALPLDPKRRWKAREIKIGDVHPLDVAWNSAGTGVYVSADDATLREYAIASGELVHKASVPAQGDHIRVLFDRYVAVLRHHDAARIPVMDTAAWDRDPVLLEIGRSPGDILPLPDGRTVVAATTDGRRVSRFDLPTGTRLADITLPHATGQLFLVRAEGRPYVAALGALTHAGRPAGAWIDLFDPTESPFGATRRSIPIGREPRAGAVTADGAAIFFPDRVSNTATLLRVTAATEARTAAVGRAPEAGFLLGDDRFGITINSAAKTATVIDTATMKVETTLMLAGAPNGGEVSPDGRVLFVTLGGTEWPPKESGVAIIAGEPPAIVGSLATGEGAVAVAVSRDGTRAAIAGYFDRSITIVEQ